MWHTNNGDRTLEKAEATLFAHVLWDFSQELEISEGEYDVDLPVFDRLTYGQKASVLSITGNGLLKPDAPIRDLTAVVECAIAAVFEFLKLEVVVECDEPDNETNWRQLILNARKQADAEDLPDADCTDAKEWINEVDELTDMILWDSDYEDEALFIDSPSGNDYFLKIAEDPRPNETKTILTDLKALCRSICG